MLLSIIIERRIAAAEVRTSNTVRSGNSNSPGATWKPRDSANLPEIGYRGRTIAAYWKPDLPPEGFIIVAGKTSGSSVQRARKLAARISLDGINKGLMVVSTPPAVTAFHRDSPESDFQNDPVSHPARKRSHRSAARRAAHSITQCRSAPEPNFQRPSRCLESSQIPLVTRNPPSNPASC